MEDIHNWQTKYASCHYADRLLSKLSELNQQVTQPVNIDEIRKGIYYAKKYHGSQMRQSGDPYYSHPIEVAYMVAEYTALEIPKYFRTDMIITSLLHDTIEDTTLTEDMIGKVFGKQIASQVVDLTRIKIDRKINASETLELLLSQNKQDVLHVKLFDRLHNMRTIGFKSHEKIRKIVEETLSYFIPFATYLGLNKVEEELSKLCLRSILTKTNLQRILAAKLHNSI
ncbi:HD domain-containing protein [Candidatus Tisiphia endosymbiont of Hybos culiciformis]|uniref:HD domain-containing protein n=1 Tax=Candidatus Tisiphia endosymbiont of Hybos culiciformis TaxID=3139331 RepID=UPI003CCAA3EE